MRTTYRIREIDDRDEPACTFTDCTFTRCRGDDIDPDTEPDDTPMVLTWRACVSLSTCAIACGYLTIQGVKLAVWLGGFVWP